MNKHNAYPVKTTLNLMIRERREENLRLLIIGGLAGVILIALFCRYAVIGRLSEAARAEEAARQAEETLRQAKAELNAYDEVEAQYSRYFSDALFSDQIPQECMDVLRLMEENLMGKASITSYRFSGNTLLLQMDVSRLSVTSELLAALYQEPMVENVSISTATDAGGYSITGGDRTDTGVSTVIMTIVLREVEE